MDKKTWNKYRAAIRWYMKNNGPVEAVELLNTLSSAPARKSHHRRGRMPEKELRQLVENLRNRSKSDDLLAIDLLYAGLATGLRPRREWHGARLVKRGDRLELIVKNAKHDRVRGNGATRKLKFLPSMAKRDIRAIIRMVRTVNSMTYPEWAKTYDRLRKRIAGARPRNSAITPYSARHQFVANCKAAGLSKAHIAALVGHASDQTAGRHYGRRIHGSGGLHVDVEPEEIATVRSPETDDPTPR